MSTVHSLRSSSLATLISLVAFSWILIPYFGAGAYAPEGSAAAQSTAATVDSLLSALQDAAPDIDPKVLELALRSVVNARELGVETTTGLLTVIDFTIHSAEPRLWVLDTDEPRVLFTERVAHGSGSGMARTESVSNVPGSRQSSLGLFLTGESYYGRNGYSMRLEGLDEGFNDHAFERAIVFHGAPYANEEFVAQHGRMGRSWGCPVVREEINRELIDTIKGGSLVFAYFPDTAWLEKSRFLQDR